MVSEDRHRALVEVQVIGVMLLRVRSLSRLELLLKASCSLVVTVEDVTSGQHIKITHTMLLQQC